MKILGKIFEKITKINCQNVKKKLIYRSWKKKNMKERNGGLFRYEEYPFMIPESPYHSKKNQQLQYETPKKKKSVNKMNMEIINSFLNVGKINQNGQVVISIFKKDSNGKEYLTEEIMPNTLITGSDYIAINNQIFRDSQERAYLKVIKQRTNAETRKIENYEARIYLRNQIFQKGGFDKYVPNSRKSSSFNGIYVTALKKSHSSRSQKKETEVEEKIKEPFIRSRDFIAIDPVVRMRSKGNKRYIKVIKQRKNPLSGDIENYECEEDVPDIPSMLESDLNITDSNVWITGGHIFRVVVRYVPSDGQLINVECLQELTPANKHQEKQQTVNDQYPTSPRQQKLNINSIRVVRNELNPKTLLYEEFLDDQEIPEQAIITNNYICVDTTVYRKVNSGRFYYHAFKPHHYHGYQSPNAKDQIYYECEEEVPEYEEFSIPSFDIKKMPKNKKGIPYLKVFHSVPDIYGNSKEIEEEEEIHYQATIGNDYIVPNQCVYRNRNGNTFVEIIRARKNTLTNSFEYYKRNEVIPDNGSHKKHRKVIRERTNNLNKIEEFLIEDDNQKSSHPKVFTRCIRKQWNPFTARYELYDCVMEVPSSYQDKYGRYMMTIIKKVRTKNGKTEKYETTKELTPTNNNDFLDLNPKFIRKIITVMVIEKNSKTGLPEVVNRKEEIYEPEFIQSSMPKMPPDFVERQVPVTRISLNESTGKPTMCEDMVSVFEPLNAEPIINKWERDITKRSPIKLQQMKSNSMQALLIPERTFDSPLAQPDPLYEDLSASPHVNRLTDMFNSEVLHTDDPRRRLRRQNLRQTKEIRNYYSKQEKRRKRKSVEPNTYTGFFSDDNDESYIPPKRHRKKKQDNTASMFGVLDIPEESENSISDIGRKIRHSKSRRKSLDIVDLMNITKNERSKSVDTKHRSKDSEKSKKDKEKEKSKDNSKNKDKKKKSKEEDKNKVKNNEKESNKQQKHKHESDEKVKKERTKSIEKKKNDKKERTKSVETKKSSKDDAKKSSSKSDKSKKSDKKKSSKEGSSSSSQKKKEDSKDNKAEKTEKLEKTKKTRKLSKSKTSSSLQDISKLSSDLESSSTLTKGSGKKKRKLNKSRRNSTGSKSSSSSKGSKKKIQTVQSSILLPINSPKDDQIQSPQKFNSTNNKIKSTEIHSDVSSFSSYSSSSYSQNNENPPAKNLPKVKENQQIIYIEEEEEEEEKKDNIPNSPTNINSNPIQLSLPGIQSPLTPPNSNNNIQSPLTLLSPSNNGNDLLSLMPQPVSDKRAGSNENLNLSPTPSLQLPTLSLPVATNNNPIPNPIELNPSNNLSLSLSPANAKTSESNPVNAPNQYFQMPPEKSSENSSQSESDDDHSDNDQTPPSLDLPSSNPSLSGLSPLPSLTLPLDLSNQLNNSLPTLTLPSSPLSVGSSSPGAPTLTLPNMPVNNNDAPVLQTPTLGSGNGIPSLMELNLQPIPIDEPSDDETLENLTGGLTLQLSSSNNGSQGGLSLPNADVPQLNQQNEIIPPALPTGGSSNGIELPQLNLNNLGSAPPPLPTGGSSEDHSLPMQLNLDGIGPLPPLSIADEANNLTPSLQLNLNNSAPPPLPTGGNTDNSPPLQLNMDGLGSIPPLLPTGSNNDNIPSMQLSLDGLDSVPPLLPTGGNVDTQPQMQLSLNGSGAPPPLPTGNENNNIAPMPLSLNNLDSTPPSLPTGNNDNTLPSLQLSLDGSAPPPLPTGTSGDNPLLQPLQLNLEAPNLNDSPVLGDIPTLSVPSIPQESEDNQYSNIDKPSDQEMHSPTPETASPHNIADLSPLTTGLNPTLSAPAPFDAVGGIGDIQQIQQLSQHSENSNISKNNNHSSESSDSSDSSDSSSKEEQPPQLQLESPQLPQLDLSQNQQPMQLQLDVPSLQSPVSQDSPQQLQLQLPTLNIQQGSQPQLQLETPQLQVPQPADSPQLQLPSLDLPQLQVPQATDSPQLQLPTLDLAQASQAQPAGPGLQLQLPQPIDLSQNTPQLQLDGNTLQLPAQIDLPQDSQIPQLQLGLPQSDIPQDAQQPQLQLNLPTLQLPQQIDVPQDSQNPQLQLQLPQLQLPQSGPSPSDDPSALASLGTATHTKKKVTKKVVKKKKGKANDDPMFAGISLGSIRDEDGEEAGDDSFNPFSF